MMYGTITFTLKIAKLVFFSLVLCSSNRIILNEFETKLTKEREKSVISFSLNQPVISVDKDVAIVAESLGFDYRAG